ncbi:dehydrogenase/reductase SDR family member 11-like isoform X2 [Adelges cooleyi]|uniref:dehydrogenase/reductase SDR family member 11-like isoform X2 n=1 Tax=Adelges cooleyi TaxID=133065 RepID=UPI00217F6852|nr:dehydrogenase/reductase SDR family member 11-like isoform X2 [Adelges cooleyi]
MADMKRWKDKVALVTGANGGIGIAITKRFLELGFTVVAVDKICERLLEFKDESKNKKLHPLNVDLCHEEEIIRAFQWVEDNFGGVDVLINNAGIGGQATLIDGTVSEWKKMLDVNVIALSICSREAVKSMISRNLENAHIIHLSSNLAHYVPTYGPFHFYSATKHAVRALTEGLRQELRDIKSPIRVTCISPGLVKSSIFKSSLGEKFDKHLYDAYPSINPSDIASTIEFILATPSHVQVQDIIIKPLGSEA